MQNRPLSNDNCYVSGKQHTPSGTDRRRDNMYQHSNTHTGKHTQVPTSSSRRHASVRCWTAVTCVPAGCAEPRTGVWAAPHNVRYTPRRADAAWRCRGQDTQSAHKPSRPRGSSGVRARPTLQKAVKLWPFRPRSAPAAPNGAAVAVSEFGRVQRVGADAAVPPQLSRRSCRVSADAVLAKRTHACVRSQASARQHGPRGLPSPRRCCGPPGRRHLTA